MNRLEHCVTIIGLPPHWRWPSCVRERMSLPAVVWWSIRGRTAGLRTTVLWTTALALVFTLAGLMLSSGAIALGVDPSITAISWSQTAQRYRGQTEDVVLYCPRNGQLADVWGSDVYADDSSICTAAVHGGLITVEDGGAIAIRLLPGQPQYLSTTQNDVTSDAWASWFGSFTFTTLHDPIAGVMTVDGQSVPIQVANWQTTATQFSEREGDVISLYCPPKGAIGSLWGTDVYREASSVCSAAVHDSQLTVTDGGTIAFVMGAGQSSYRDSTRNGITSRAFGRSSASFRVVPVQ